PSGELRGVIPEPELDGALRERPGNELGGFCRGKSAALQGETALGVGGERIVVSGPRLTQITFGVDVQTNRLEDPVIEQSAQEWQREILMDVVDPAPGRRVSLVVEQMAKVVQQGRGDQLGIGAGSLRQRGAL